MKWKGKLIGFLLGLLTRRPQFMVIGMLLGHLYDIGLFGGKITPPAPLAAPPMADPYAILDVSPSASDDDVEQAYRRKISDYHPDRVANAANEIRELAGERSREINGAYKEIKRQRSR